MNTLKPPSHKNKRAGTEAVQGRLGPLSRRNEKKRKDKVGGYKQAAVLVNKHVCFRDVAYLLEKSIVCYMKLIGQLDIRSGVYHSSYCHLPMYPLGSLYARRNKHSLRIIAPLSLLTRFCNKARQCTSNYPL